MGTDRPYLVVDLEGTCCDDDSIPLDERETIEIGAVLCHPETLLEIVQYQTFVRPVRHPILTTFCMRLTAICQEHVDSAQPFGDEFRRFAFWLEDQTASRDFDEPIFCSWGRYDKEQFGRDFAYHGMTSPFQDHLDLSGLFKKKTGRKRGHRGAMKLFGLVPEGCHHRGLSDAKNIAKMLPFLLN